MELEAILLLIITVLIIALALFFADKLIGDKPDSLGGGYLFKAILTAIIIIVLIIGVSAIIGVIGVFGISQIAPILAFVMGAYAIKYFLLQNSSFERAIWVALITWTIIYVIDYLAQLLGGLQLVQFI